jgi:hypothetical protein
MMTQSIILFNTGDKTASVTVAARSKELLAMETAISPGRIL